MLKNFSFTLLSLSIWLNAYDVSAANPTSCNASGFQCTPKCPVARGGHEYKEIDCVCRKNRETRTCIPSGECAEYTVGGRPTQTNAKSCECNKSETIYIEDETAATGAVGGEGAL